MARFAALPSPSHHQKQNEPAVLRPDCAEPRRYIRATLRVMFGKRIASDLPATRGAGVRMAPGSYMRSWNITGDGPTKWVTCSRNRSRRI